MSGLVFQDDNKVTFTTNYLTALDNLNLNYNYILAGDPFMLVANLPGGWYLPFNDTDFVPYRSSYHKNMANFVPNVVTDRTPFDLNENAWFRKKIPVPYWMQFFENRQLLAGEFTTVNTKYTGRFTVTAPVWTVRPSWMNTTYYLFWILMLIFCMMNANFIYSILEKESNLSTHQFYKRYKFTRAQFIVCYYILWSIAYLIMMSLVLYLFERLRNADWFQRILFPTYTINGTTIPQLNRYNDGWWMRWFLIGLYVGILGTMIYFAVDFWRQRRSRRKSYHTAFIVFTVVGILCLGLLFWAAINTTCLYFFNPATNTIEARNPLCQGEERQLPQYWERRQGEEGFFNLGIVNPYVAGGNYDFNPAKKNATLYYSDGTFRAAS